MRTPGAALCLAFALAGCSEPTGAAGASHLVRINPIFAENALLGDPDWQSGVPGSNGLLEAYADRSSAFAGQEVGLHVSASAPSTVGWILYRLGWYGGAGARRIAEGTLGSTGPQTPCPVETGTGLVRCAWPVSVAIPIPPAAISGLYLFKLSRDDGPFTFVPLIVEDGRSADLLFQSSVSTWQAYNRWGGTSLYVDSLQSTPFGRAVKASFDRPYDSDDGSGQLLRYEVHFARFLERYGYDVSYTTNITVSNEGLGKLRAGQAFLSVGHDEYWTLSERNALEKARDRGVSLLFFGANTGYWKIRLEEERDPGNHRTIVSYKGDAASDPVNGPERTGLWRGPIGRPENELIGVMYESWTRISGAWVVSDPSHFLYEGTGLGSGDAIPGIVGYEYDRTFANGRQPSTLEVMARSPILDVQGVPGWSEAASYRDRSGTLVFSAASIEWSWGLGKEGIADPRIERMTANAIREATGLPIPLLLGEGSGKTLPSYQPALASRIRTVARGLEAPTDVEVLDDKSLVIVDSRSHQLLSSRDGAVAVIAGDGQPSSDWAFDDVPGTMARFHGPTAVVADEAGFLYVADTGNHCIRRIAPDAARTVTTLAGAMGRPGLLDGEGTTARFRSPMGLALHPQTGFLIVADAGNGRIRTVDRATGETHTLAGGGTSPVDGPAARTAFSFPTAVAALPDGGLLVVDTGYGQIRRIASDGDRSVVTLVYGPLGDGDGSGEHARLSPQGGAVWIGDGLLISEPTRFKLRKLVPGSDAAGTRVYTFAGGSFGDRDGDGEEARFGLPVGLAYADGTVFVADAGGGSIRAIAP